MIFYGLPIFYGFFKDFLNPKPLEVNPNAYPKLWQHK